MMEAMTGAEVIGPLLQGLARPVMTLTRGCSTDDVINVIAISCNDAQFIEAERKRDIEFTSRFENLIAV